MLALLPASAGMPLSASAADNWVSEYPRVAVQAESDCAIAASSNCRRELLRMLELVDGRPDIAYRLAKVEARLAHRDASLHSLAVYARSGLDLGDPAQEPAFENLRADPYFDRLLAAYRAFLKPADTHTVLATMPGRDLIAEDLALDRRDGSRYVSSVRAGKVLRLDSSGHWTDFLLPPGLSAWGLYALAVDPLHDRIWVSSVAGAVSPPYRTADRGRSAVLQINLRNRAVERRYELADGKEHALGDMALGVDGTVYVSDGLGGGVYRIEAEANARLAPLVPDGSLRSPQTPVPLPDGARLLVPDYSRGIAVIDLERQGAMTWLAHDAQLALYGIDGLYLRGQELIAIQNGTVPERLLLLRLDPGFTRVTSWTVLLARAPGLGDPTHGFVAGRQFQFIANSGWDRVDEQGHLDTAATAENPAIWSIQIPD
jgi:hypothetical protein